MDVSIVIVNYKTTDLIVNCIKSIREYTRNISYEIIIVDNNSNDDCHETLKRIFPRENWIFIALDNNKGFGMANNEGFKVAKGRNILCLNPDTLLMNNAVKILSSFLDNHKDIGACGGNLYDEELCPTFSFSRMLPSLLWELNILAFGKIEKLLYKNNRNFNNTKTPIEVGYITGADLMIKKNVIEQTGGYSPEFFMYYEDTDLCCRIKRKGYKVTSVPTANIQHLEGKSFDRGKNNINEKRIGLSEKSRLIYYMMNVGKFETWLSCKVYIFGLFVNEVFFLLSRNEIWKYYNCRRRMIKLQRRKMKGSCM